MTINPEKPKVVRAIRPSVSREARKIKRFLTEHDPVVLYLETILLDTFELLKHYRAADYSRDVATLRRRYDSEGLSFATKTLPTLFTNFLSWLEGGKPSYPGFKLCKGAEYPVFLRQLFAMASKCDDVDRVKAMECLYQLCYAFKKLKGPYRKGTLQKQLWSFVQTDIELRYLDFSEPDVGVVLSDARGVVTKLCGDLSPEFDTHRFIPRPGPGATNTPTRKNVRYRPHVLYQQLDEVFPYEDWFYSHIWDLRTDPMAYLALERVEAPTSRFKFVDKTYAKPRGICIEELETQYLQQGLKSALYDRLEKHPLTRGRINFADQSVNGDLARISSGDRRYATIDMSEASDRISRSLVKKLFAGCPDLLEALLAVSTRTIELPEDIPFIRDFPCEKFAPMGSAVCFPIMSLVHFVLIRGILTMCGHPQDSAHDVYVYGDDILVRTECVQDVYKWLPKFGMKLNEEKSYYKSFFRESCGTHAYYGVEITPVYFKYIPKSHSRLSEVVSFASCERDLFRKGFKNTASLVRSETMKVKKLRGVPLPYVSPKSPVLGWIRSKGGLPLKPFTGLKRRFDQTVQSWTYCVRVVSPRVDDTSIEKENECYLRWLIEHPNKSQGASPEDHSRTVPSELTIPTQRRSLLWLPICDYDREVIRWQAVTTANVAKAHAEQVGALDVADAQSVKESRPEDFTIRWAFCPDSAF